MIWTDNKAKFEDSPNVGRTSEETRLEKAPGGTSEPCSTTRTVSSSFSKKRKKESVHIGNRGDVCDSLRTSFIYSTISLEMAF